MREREAPVIIYESINRTKWDCECRDIWKASKTEMRARAPCPFPPIPLDVVQTDFSYSWNEKPVRWLVIL